MKLSLSLIKFFLIGALFIISNHQLYLTDVDDRAVFADMFYSWLGNIFNHALEITGFVVNSEWLPGNSSSGVINVESSDLGLGTGN